ncbi:hypothetical protein D3C80_1798050 [compost metagenome]
MRIDEIGGLCQLRRGNARRQVDDAVFDLIVIPHKNGKGLERLKPDKLDMFYDHIILGGNDEPGAPRHAGQCLTGLGHHAL